MAITIKGQVFAAGAASNTVTTGTLDSTDANLLVIGVIGYESTNFPTTAPTDSKTNTWVGLTYRESSAGFDDVGCRIWYCTPTSVGTSHTATFTLTGCYPSLFFGAYAGAAASSPADQQNGTGETASDNSISAGSITPTEDNELVVSILSLYGSSVAGMACAGMTGLVGSAVNSGTIGGSASYLIQTSLGAINPGWSWTTNYPKKVAAVASFKAAAVAAGSNPAAYIGAGYY